MIRYRNAGVEITFEIHNGYSVVAVINSNRCSDVHKVKLYIEKEEILLRDLIEDCVVECEIRQIKTRVAEYVTQKLIEGHFQKFVERYEYMLACFDKGNSLFEEARTNAR